MSKVSTNKKLELVRAIRMQNQYDRQLLRMREGFLYPDLPRGSGAELYSLEELPKPSNEGKSRSLIHFRIRFVIALLLLLSFIFCDVNHISFGKENSDTFFQQIKSSTDMEALIEQLKWEKL